MNLLINGENVLVEQDELNLPELLVLRNVESPDMVSVQVNGEFVPKENFTNTGLKDRDEVDFLYFMGGGR